MRVLAGRRPEVMLLAALLIFGLMLALRALQDRPAPPLAIDTAAPAPVAGAVDGAARDMTAEIHGR